MFTSPDGLVLLLKRREKPQHWEVPGGRADEADQSVWKTARREVKEEIGVLLPRTQPEDRRITGNEDWAYTTFIVNVDMFVPMLSDEHLDYVWQSPMRALDNLELQAGVKKVLEEMRDG